MIFPVIRLVSKQVLRLLTTVAVLVLCCSIEAQAASANETSQAGAPKKSDNQESQQDQDFYNIIKDMKCGKFHVSSVSSCYVSDAYNETPFCFLQTFTSVDPQNFKSKSVVYSHPMRDGTPNFVYFMSCVKVGGNDFIVLSNTNYSPCGECEWIDVLRADGTFVGTSAETAKDLAQPFKHLDERLESSVDRRDAEVSSKAEIDRQSGSEEKQ